VKIFLDTNVIVSALATRGLCADVFREVLAFHDLIESEPLILELKRILTHKIKLPTVLIHAVIDLIQRDSEIPEQKVVEELDGPIQDKADIAILASAMNGDADWFVTGDKEPVEVKKIGSMEIMTPRIFWERVQET